jgi:hypothetical protein
VQLVEQQLGIQVVVAVVPGLNQLFLTVAALAAAEMVVQPPIVLDI